MPASRLPRRFPPSLCPRSHIRQAGWIEAGVAVATTTHARHHHARARRNAALFPRQHAHTRARVCRPAAPSFAGPPVPSSSRMISVAVVTLAGAAEDAPLDWWLGEATRPGAVHSRISGCSRSSTREKNVIITENCDEEIVRPTVKYSASNRWSPDTTFNDHSVLTNRNV